MYLFKVIKFIFTTFVSLFFAFSFAFGQAKESSASTVAKSVNTKPTTIIECYHCHGGGVSTSQVDCSNCISWSKEDRKKFQCLKCHGRQWNLVGNVCFVCKGKGKIAVTPEELKLVAKIKEQQKKEEEESNARIKTIPKHNGVMSDAEATAYFNAHVDPTLRQEENLAADYTMGKPEDLDEKQQKAFDSLLKKIAVPLDEKEISYKNVLQKAADGMASPETRLSIRDVSITWKFSDADVSLDVIEKVIINSAYFVKIVKDGKVISKDVFKNGTLLNNEGVLIQEPRPAVKEQFNRKLAFFDEAYLLAQNNYQFTFGEEKVNGEKAYVVEVTTPFGRKETNYYNVSSGLKIASVSSGDSPVTTFYLDYKSFNGVKIPTKTISQTNGTNSREMQLVDVKFNIGLDARDFK